MSLVALAIARSANIESLFGGILLTMLGAQAGPAAAMYQALESTNAQTDVVLAAAEAVLEQHDLDVFEIIAAKCRRATKHRHRFAHWIWADSHTLDALIFIEPAALLECELHDRMGIGVPNEGRGLPEVFDRSRALVYNESDLKTVVNELYAAEEALAQFRFTVLPVFKDYPEWRDRLSLGLLNQPEIADGLAALAEKRKTDPSARAQPRRKQGRAK